MLGEELEPVTSGPQRRGQLGLRRRGRHVDLVPENRDARAAERLGLEELLELVPRLRNLAKSWQDFPKIVANFGSGKEYTAMASWIADLSDHRLDHRLSEPAARWSSWRASAKRDRSTASTMNKMPVTNAGRKS